MVFDRCIGPAISPAGVGCLDALVALLCCGIILVAGVPGMHALSREWSLRVGAEMLESSLLWGRMHAISANTSVMLVVDRDGRRFFWADPFNGNPYQGSVRAFPPGVRITSSPRRPVRFYQHGNAAPAGTFVVGGEHAEYRLVVSPGGRIRVQRS